jgi:PKD repeat protein
VFNTNGSSSLCGVQGYSLQTVDLSAYADGNQHLITFISTTVSVNGGPTNFFVDDISFFVCDDGIPGPVCNDTVAFTGSPLGIPDNDPAGVQQAKSVTGINGTLGVDVQLKQVCFNIDHTWVGDLIVSVTAPNGIQVLLTDRPGVPATAAGCGGSNINVCVETGTGNEMESVCGTLPAISGIFTAANGSDLEAINNAGGSPNGTWQIFISDNDTTETGSLTDWSLVFETGPVANWTSPDTVCATAGTVNLNQLLGGTPGGTWSGVGVTGNTFDPSGLNGSIPVTYNVTDPGTGCSDNETNIIHVVPGAPTPVFAANPISLDVTFTNFTTGTNSYQWNFGDGNLSSDENPTHTYALGGTYTVTLTATNACGSNSLSQTVTVIICPTAINDGSFENGPGGGAWTETSTNFNTPICDPGNCGTGGGTGPRTGSYWAWFGGVAQFEESSVSQTFTIPVNNGGMLYFWLEQIECDSSADFLKVVVDADTLYTTDGGSNLCGQLGYSLINVNLTAYADGNPHTLKFFSRVYGLNGGITSFFVDDISVNVCTGIGFADNHPEQQVQVMPVPTHDYLDVRTGNKHPEHVTILVTDMAGKSVYQTEKVIIGKDQTHRINTTNWNAGIYLMKVSGISGNAFRKVIIQ